ncbi:MAG TPA: hypothetical protein DDW76_11930 [Cyanobacteria bacterium UBA11369]|nr:hypothetical protein [Cyanobacteria bacterium UBA11371]HBE32795.1 hypothetical protein [Cyanobacteria bacterium UBA11368]HBE49480.1 hypothetical protein [Cyanobacteria bacterium UBA11369]
MTGEAPKQPGSKENVNPPTGSEDLVDPRDLVRTSGIPEHPEEVLSNPAVAPQMPDDSLRDLRGDLSKEA